MFNIFNIIILIGLIQGFVVSILLMLGQNFNRSKIYLALNLFGYSAILLRITFVDIIQFDGYPPIIINFILLVAPSLYLYVVSQSNRILKHKTIIVSFLPFVILNSVYLIFYLIFSNAVFYQNILLIALKFDEIVTFIYFFVYIIYAINYLKLNASLYVPVQLKWLKILSFMQLILLTIWLVYLLVQWIFEYKLSVKSYYPMMIMLSIILYYSSFYVYSNRQSLLQSIINSKRKKYLLTDEEGQNLLKRLNLLMVDEKPYLNGSLSLNILSELLEVNPKTLSFVINEHCNKNFNDFINEWRVKEVKSRLKDRKFKNLKIISIAYDCGFNSKSTFNLAFKKLTGMSPSAYQKSI